jgi:hypothetical protein
MTQSVSLSLPLSATALRLGATLLTDLAASAELILAESRGPTIVFASSNPEADFVASEAVAQQDIVDVMVDAIQNTALEQDVKTAEAETPEQRQYRLHGNVASAGMEPITQETLPPVEYETVVTGHAAGPVPFAAGHDQASYAAAGWTIEAMVNAGHLVEVTEQRPLAVAPGALPAPLAPAPAPAPASNGVQLDKDGLPWDSRIHSDAAEKMSKAGVWKTRKNLPEGYKPQIEAELRAVMSASAPGATTATTAPAPAADPNATTTTVAVAAPPAPSAAPAPAPSPAPVAPVAAPAGNAFAEFTRWLVGHTKAGKLSQTDAVLEIQKQGLTQIPDLAKRPDLIPEVMAALTAAKGL